MDEALIKRVPPHSIEAEQSVVGAMLMDRDAITTASEIICGDDFYQTAYGVIFDSEIKVVECWKVIADKYGIADIESQCHACLGTTREMSRAIMLEHYGADFPYDIYKKEMSDLFHSRYGGGRLPKKAGAVELLQYLQ